MSYERKREKKTVKKNEKKFKKLIQAIFGDFFKKNDKIAINTKSNRYNFF